MNIVSRIQQRFGSRRGLIRYLQAQVFWRLGGYRRFSRVPEPVMRLVFVCTGNVCRSAYAERMARRQGLTSASFGLATDDGLPANKRMQHVGQEFGVDLGEHRTTSAESYRYRPGDFLLAMEPAQCEALVRRFGDVPIALLGLWANNPRAYLHDPYSACDAYMHFCARLIESAVCRLNASLTNMRITVDA